MRRINLFFILLACFSLLCVSCTENQLDKLETENVSLIPDDFHISFDPSTPTTFKLGEVNLSDLITSLNQELYEINFEEVINNEGYSLKSETQIYIGYNLNINGNTEIITIQPIFGPRDNKSESSDDKKCGGEDGDNWKLYGTCMSEDCVEVLSNQAAKELKKELKSGKCLDIRVKRNPLNARVCGRVIDC